VLGISCAVVLLFRLVLLVRRGYKNPSELVRSIALPVAFVLLPASLWMGYYNYRVTGHPLLMPYELYEEQYSARSQFLWLNNPRPERNYNHKEFRVFWMGWDVAEKQVQRQHVLYVHVRNLLALFSFFFWVPLFCGLLFTWPRLLRNPSLRIPFVLLLLFYLGLSVESNLVPHYFAPATVLVFLIATAAIQDVSSRFAAGKRRTVATGALFCCIALFELPWITHPLHRFHYDLPLEFGATRDLVVKRLEKRPGKFLVFVRYGPNHNIHYEWVYNDANIDQSRIAWARAMPDGKDEELLRYYPNRQAWVLDDDGKFTLRPMEDNPQKPSLRKLIHPVDKSEDGLHG
jgi:hypothetical protein